jgi:hypothetical protein
MILSIFHGMSTHWHVVSDNGSGEAQVDTGVNEGPTLEHQTELGATSSRGKYITYCREGTPIAVSIYRTQRDDEAYGNMAL